MVALLRYISFVLLPRSRSGHPEASDIAPNSAAVTRSALLEGPGEACQETISDLGSMGEPTKQSEEGRRARLGV